MRAVLMDNGALSALLNPDDEWHTWARDIKITWGGRFVRMSRFRWPPVRPCESAPPHGIVMMRWRREAWPGWGRREAYSAPGVSNNHWGKPRWPRLARRMMASKSSAGNARHP